MEKKYGFHLKGLYSKSMKDMLDALKKFYTK
jgi:hypothetical protein